MNDLLASPEQLVAAVRADSTVQSVTAALPTGFDIWLVGGALRDCALGRPLLDIDLATSGDAARVARTIHSKLGGDIFTLSDRFGTWRVITPAKVTVDVSQLRGQSIAEDLALRDFSVSSMALQIASSGNPGDAASGQAALIDPHNGLADLASRTLRVLGAQSYVDDPLRTLRLVRLAATLDLQPDSGTLALTKLHADSITETAIERVWAELKSLIACDDLMRGLKLLADTCLLDALLPELAALRGMDQTVYHHLDAYGHTLEVVERMLDIQRDPSTQFGADAEAISMQLDEPLAEGLSRSDGLRLGAIFHDLGKASTRTDFGEGRIGFPGHDTAGADIAKKISKRWHTSDRLSAFVQALVQHHLVLGFMVHDQPLGRRDLYGYMKRCEPVELEVTLLTAADRLATRGRKSEEAIGRHMPLAQQVVTAAIDWRKNRPAAPLVRGGELAQRLGIRPGPELGQLLEAIAEARYVGDVETPDQAIALAESLRAEA